MCPLDEIGGLQEGSIAMHISILGCFLGAIANRHQVAGELVWSTSRDLVALPGDARLIDPGWLPVCGLKPVSGLEPSFALARLSHLFLMERCE